MTVFISAHLVREGGSLSPSLSILTESRHDQSDLFSRPGRIIHNHCKRHGEPDGHVPINEIRLFPFSNPTMAC